MAEHFSLPQLVDYLTPMGLQLAQVDLEQEMLELAFHGNQGQWCLMHCRSWIRYCMILKHKTH